MPSTYISGHHSSVLTSHRWRTAANSAAYLLPHLTAHLDRSDPTNPCLLLDIGCGPGTITLDFAALLAPHHGRVVGIDPSESVIQQAKEEAKARGINNVEFLVGDALNLDFADATFDFTHAHQVLQHLSDPVRALIELRRVTKKGGVTAAREAIFSATTIWPDVEGLDSMIKTWTKVIQSDGASPNAGKMLVTYALAAGFERSKITAGAGSWCYSGDDSAWWGQSWSERCLKSDFPKRAVSKGFATQEDMQTWSQAFLTWGQAPDAWFGLFHGEIVCFK